MSVIQLSRKFLLTRTFKTIYKVPEILTSRASQHRVINPNTSFSQIQVFITRCYWDSRLQTP